MTRDAAIIIAKKLKALAEKSVGGEKDASTKKLGEFCIKHGLDADEYSIEIIKVASPFVGANEKLLLSCIMCMILEVDGVRGKIENDHLIFQCTDRQYDDIMDAFSHYKKIYYDYVDGAMLAIINRNEIKNRKCGGPEFKMEDMTDAERQEYEDFMTRNRSDPPEPENKQPTESNMSDEERSSDAERTVKKNERIQRMFMAVESNKWIKKIKAKFFLG